MSNNTVRYVLCEKGFEYNDEGYDPAGIETLVHIYDNVARAEQEAKKLAEKRFESEGNDYYSLSDYLRDHGSLESISDGYPHILTISLEKTDRGYDRESVTIHDYVALAERYWNVFYEILPVKEG